MKQGYNSIAMKKIILTILILLFVGGCGRNSEVLVTETAVATTPTLEPTITPVPSPTPVPTPGLPPAPQGLTKYTLEAELDYGAKTLQVSEWVDYTNRSTEPITELTFVVHASRFAYVFEYQSAYLDGQQLFNEKLSAGYLTLPLPAPLNPGETRQIKLAYRLVLREREGTLGYTTRQVNLANWFPILPPYVAGTGWLVHEPGGFGEYMVFDAADFDVRLKLIGDGLIAAASTTAEADGEWLHYQLSAARNFTISVSPYYRVKQESFGDAVVTSYWFTDNDPAGEMALQTSLQALSLYSELFAPFPRKSLSVVESDFLHGMEYDGLFFLSRGFYENYPGNAQSNLVIIGAHETSHQWWYSLIGNDQAVEPWLDEGLATYCEYLFYEKYYPDLTGWWWDNRILFFAPGGWVDGNIYNPEGYEKYRNGVYLRGAQFFDELRTTIGDEAFFAFLKDYALSRAYTITNKDEFLSILKLHTQADIGPIMEQYFENP